MLKNYILRIKKTIFNNQVKKENKPRIKSITKNNRNKTKQVQTKNFKSLNKPQNISFPLTILQNVQYDHLHRGDKQKEACNKQIAEERGNTRQSLEKLEVENMQYAYIT